MKEILAKSKRTNAEYKILAKHYREKLGRSVCLSCPGDVHNMISGLKQIYNMSNFQLARAFAQYKNKKTDTVTISNSTMTDEKAIEFLKTNPDRISLFSKKPENWEELILSDVKTDSELEAEKAIADAEAAAKKSDESEDEKIAEDLIKEKEEAFPGDDIIFNDLENDEDLDGNDLAKALEEAGAEVSGNAGAKDEDDDCCDEHSDDEPCDDCKEKKRAELMEMKLSELRKAYPEIKAVSTKDFVDQVVG